MINVLHEPDRSRVYIGSFLVATFCCGHMALAFEKRLHAVETEPTEEMALSALVAHTGCCNDTAAMLYSLMTKRTLQ